MKKILKKNSDEENSNEENSDKENFDEENSDEKNTQKNTHIVKLIFTAYKKLIKHFFIFFSIYKNVNRILSKNKEKL